jgi:hypothetical protein
MKTHQDTVQEHSDATAPAGYRSASTLARWEKKAPVAAPADFVPLQLETRTHVSTAVMCRHIVSNGMDAPTRSGFDVPK